MESIKNKLKSKIFLLFVAFGLFLSVAAGAQSPSQWLDRVGPDLTQIGNTAYHVVPGTEPKDVRQIVASVIQVILGLLGTICVIMIVIAGYNYMTAQGNQVKIQTAIKTIINAGVGLLIILASFAITIYVSRVTIGSSENITQFLQDNTTMPKNR